MSQMYEILRRSHKHVLKSLRFHSGLPSPPRVAFQNPKTIREKLVRLTVCSYHVTHAFQNESTLYSCVNVKELLAQNRREIWSLSDCNWTRTLNHLARKRTLDHLAKLGRSKLKEFIYKDAGINICGHSNCDICKIFESGNPINFHYLKKQTRYLKCYLKRVFNYK